MSSSIDVPRSSVSRETSLLNANARPAWSTSLNVASDGQANAGAGISLLPASTVIETAVSSQPSRHPLMSSNANFVPAPRNRPQIVAGPLAGPRVHFHARPQFQGHVQTQIRGFVQPTAQNFGKPAGLSIVNFTNRDNARAFPTLPGYFSHSRDYEAFAGESASAPLARSSPPASNEAAQIMTPRGNVGAIGDGRRRAQFSVSKLKFIYLLFISLGFLILLKVLRLPGGHCIFRKNAILRVVCTIWALRIEFDLKHA
jgi:hypothetical protein